MRAIINVHKTWVLLTAIGMCGNYGWVIQIAVHCKINKTMPQKSFKQHKTHKKNLKKTKDKTKK